MEVERGIIMIIKCEYKIVELWKTIKGYEDYVISSKGNVKRKAKNNRKGKLIKQYTTDSNGNPSLIVRLKNKEGKYTSLLVGVLVGETFLPKVEGFDRIKFMDGNKQNVNLTNLERSKDLKKKVVCLSTKKVFDSMTKAIFYYGLDEGNLELARIKMSQCCRGIIESFGCIYGIRGKRVALRWAYYEDYINSLDESTEDDE